MLVRVFRPSLAAVAVAALSVFAVACGGTPTSPTPPFSQVDLKVGTGVEAVNGKQVSVNYSGWLYDASAADNKGLQFDTSIGRAPFVFLLGGNTTIPGFEQGVPGMKIGGVRRLVIPPSLGYGPNRNGPIPPNSTLIFDIELLDVTDPAQAAGSAR